MPQPLRTVAFRRLIELLPDPRYPRMQLQVRLVDDLECGHEVWFFTGNYEPRPQRRCPECAGGKPKRV